MMLSAHGALLLLIDLQVKLMPAITGGVEVVRRAGLLAEAARLLEIPVHATEQYPQGLGPTVADLAGYPDHSFTKTSFGAVADPGCAGLVPAGTRQVVVTGCEAHVCVLQTVLGLLDAGHQVALVADAVGSRHQSDRAAALDRARRYGADIVTSEMVIFEWLATSTHPRFREVQRLIR